MIRLYGLQTEHLEEPMGIDAANPRFGWKIDSSEPNVLQESYRIVVREGLKVLWDSGEVFSRECQNVCYQGKKLRSRQKLEWEVSVKAAGKRGKAKSKFEMGLLEISDWKARWIAPDEKEIKPLRKVEEGCRPAPYLRKEFEVRRGLKSARIYQTAHGIYRYWINGEECTEARFTPGNTSYYRRLQYQTDDITKALKQGKNCWTVIIGDGWWRGACGSFSIRNNYGTEAEYLGQIELKYEDGTMETVYSDKSFLYTTGGLLQSDMKLGTVYDAFLEPESWKEADTAICPMSWKSVNMKKYEPCDYENLIAQSSPPVKEQECFEGRSFIDSAGDRCVDFGQNIAGYVRMKFRKCCAGQKITIEHGEALWEGHFDNSNIFIRETSLHQMFQEVIYYAKGSGEECYSAEFSVCGFRYIRITGYEGEILPGDFTAVSVYSDLEQTGEFSCSSPLINQLFHNTVWSQKSNFLDVPTDCPTRERSAYTGDAQVYCKTAADLMDVYAFFEKWMKELRAEQASDGQVPTIMPAISFHSEQCRQEFLERMADSPETEFLRKAISGGQIGEPQILDGSAGWGDAAVLIPYTMYLCYGDKKILEEQYESAKRWVAYMQEHAAKKNPLYENEERYHTKTFDRIDAEYIWDTDFHWGEWSEPAFVERTLPADFIDEKCRVGEPAVATAYFAYSAEILGKIAQAIGREEDAKFYLHLSEKIKILYDKYLIREDGQVRYTEENRQAPYVRVLAFGLCSEEKKKLVLKKLKEAVIYSNYHLNTGFLSTGLLLPILVKYGMKEEAYRILEQETAPSWLYPVVNGATTIYESWDGVQNYFGSFNHYSFGAVCDFLFQQTCGIRLDEKAPGYCHVILEPVIGGTLTWAGASIETGYGKISSSWEKMNDKIRYVFEVPANTTASIRLNGVTEEVGSGIYEYWE